MTYKVSVEPVNGSAYRLPYDYANEPEARERAVKAFAEGPFRTVAIIKMGGKRRERLVDCYDGCWSSTYGSDE